MSSLGCHVRSPGSRPKDRRQSCVCLFLSDLPFMLAELKTYTWCVMLFPTWQYYGSQNCKQPNIRPNNDKAVKRTPTKAESPKWDCPVLKLVLFLGAPGGLTADCMSSRGVDFNFRLGFVGFSGWLDLQPWLFRLTCSNIDWSHTLG